MDQSVRNLLNKKMKLGGQELNVSDVLLLAAITVLAVWVRTAVRSLGSISPAVQMFLRLSKWLSFPACSWVVWLLYLSCLNLLM